MLSFVWTACTNRLTKFIWKEKDTGCKKAAVSVGDFGKAGAEKFKKIESAMRNSADDVYDDEGCEG